MYLGSTRRSTQTAFPVVGLPASPDVVGTGKRRNTSTHVVVGLKITPLTLDFNRPEGEHPENAESGFLTRELGGSVGAGRSASRFQTLRGDGRHRGGARTAGQREEGAPACVQLWLPQPHGVGRCLFLQRPSGLVKMPVWEAAAWASSGHPRCPALEARAVTSCPSGHWAHFQAAEAWGSGGGV